MKALKKVLTSVCGALAFGCLAIGGLSLKTDVAKAGSNGENYFFGGASVRLVNDIHGPGVKFHIWMTLDEFDCYGSINGDTLTLDSGYTTGTIILPHYLLKGDELTYGYVASNGAKAHCEYTNNLWHKVEIDHLWYAESVVYLYNIPESQYGTEMAVRGVVFKDGEPIRYTQQEGGISMSYVANEEYKDANSKLNSEQLESLYNTYIKKNVNVVANGVSHSMNVDYLDGIGEIVTEKQEDGDEFAYFSTATGKQVSLEEITKNHQPLLYAVYRESIVLNAATPSYNLGDYKRNATDTVKSMTFTAKDGTTYDLGANPDDVTTGAGYETLKTSLADHGEGTVTAVLNDGSADYTLSLPALVVTADIADAATLDSVRTYADTNAYYNATSKTIDGYFRITADIDVNSTQTQVSNASAAALSHTDSSNGFIGTIDGLGHTYTMYAPGSRGIFGVVGEGGYIKNWSITPNSYWNNGYCAVFGFSMLGATLENVTITTKSTIFAEPNYGSVGYLTCWGASGCTFRNVTVNLTNCSIKSLFGGMEYADYEKKGQNVFESLYITATSVEWIGTHKRTQPTGSSTYTYEHTTIADEVAAGGNIIYNATSLDEERVTLSERQDFVLNGTTANRKFALDLGAHDDGFTVESITFNGFDLGTNPNGLAVSALKADFSAHGEGDILVTLTKEKVRKTVIVPALFITQEVFTESELKNVLLFNTGNPFYDGTAKAIFGYFRLKNDVSVAQWSNHGNNDSTFTHSKEEMGFRGVFDGATHTLSTNNAGAFGLFTSIGEGAVIKDVNIQHTIYLNQGYASILANYIQGATLENVTITSKSTQNYDATKSESDKYAQMGYLSVNGASGSTFKNVEIYTNGDIHTVFGGYSWKEYEKESIGQNVYDGFIINATTVDCLGFRNVNGVATAVTIDDEIKSGEHIMENGEGWTENTITLNHTEEFMMLHTTFFIDIGEYANQKIESITLDGVDLGKDVTNLDLSAFITDYKNHGKKTIKVVCSEGSTRTTINVPALLISQDIWTESDLKGVLLFKASNRFYDATAKAIFGYFCLKDDIFVSKHNWTNHSQNDSFTHTNNAQGFRGTFDGAGKTISSNNAGAFGLFTSIGEGAFIKNVNITHNTYLNSGYAPILANYIQGATLENVTITSKSTQNYDATKSESDKYSQMGYLSVNGASGTTFRNVTVNPGGKIYTLFGGYTWQEYEKANIGQNVYENFVVNATTVDYVGFRSVSNVSTGISMEEEIFSGSGIRYNGNTVEDLAADITFEHQDIVLAGANAENGSKQKIDFGMYQVYGQKVKEVSILKPSGEQQNFTFAEGIDLLNGNITEIIPKDIIEDVTLHGEGYTVVVTTQYDTKVTIPVSIVTYEITKAAELENSESGLLMFNGQNPYFNATTNTIDGYFTLGNDISLWSIPNNTTGNTTGFNFDDVNQGFIGTFDGRTYTMKMTSVDIVDANGNQVLGRASTFGVFGQLGTGAHVKNLNLVVSTYAHNQHASALAETAYNATIENVSISVTTINGDAYGYGGDETVPGDIKGLITARAIGGCTFTDVTVDLNGGRVTSLFGGRHHNGYEDEDYAGQNTYNGLVIKGTVDYMGTGMKADARYNFTIQEEIDSGANITYTL